MAFWPLYMIEVRSRNSNAVCAPSLVVFCSRHTTFSSAPCTTAVSVPANEASLTLPVTFTLSPALSVNRLASSIGLLFTLSTLMAVVGILSLRAGSPSSVYCSLLALKSEYFIPAGISVTIPANDALAIRAASPTETSLPSDFDSTNLVNNWFI